MSIRIKFSLWISLLILVVIFTSSMVLYIAEKKLLLNKMEEARKSLIKTYSQSCRDLLLLRDEIAIVNYVKIVKDAIGVIEVALTDPAGRIIAHSNVRKIGSVYEAPKIAAVLKKENIREEYYKGQNNEDRFGLAEEIEIAGRNVGTARIIFSQSLLNRAMEKTLKEVGKRILFVSLGALLVGIIGALLLAKTITDPIKKIAEGTQLIAQGKLDCKIHLNRKDEIGKLSGDFNRMAEKLGELDRMKNDFISNVTHELRSPLSAIESYVNLISDGILEEKKENEVEYLAIIRNNAIRLGRFISDLLDLSKIEAKKLEIEKNPQNINEIIGEIVDLFKVKAAEGKISIEEDLSKDLPLISVDADKIRQVLTNLLSNALKFSPEGGKIIIRAEKIQTQPTAPSPHPINKGFIKISFIDTGIGIPKEDLDRIFNKFEQVKEMKEKVKGLKGTGLGLAISKSIVETHNGQIWAESEVGKGSAFYFTLPL